MPMSKPLACCLIAAIVALPRPSGAFPQDASPLVLRLKAHPGDSWERILQSTTRTVLKGMEERIAVSSTLRTTVEAVAPNGRMTLRQESKIDRLWARDFQGSTVTANFDSDNPSDREAARGNPEGAEFLALLDKIFTMRIEEEPTGQLRRSLSGVDPANPIIEQIMTEGICTLPEGPVRIGDQWDGGTLSTPMAGLGRLDISRQVVFDSIGVRNGEMVANLKVTGQVTVKPDAESDVTVSVIGAKVDDLYALAIDRGRMVGGRENASIKLTITQNGQQSSGLIEITFVVREK